MRFVTIILCFTLLAGCQNKPGNKSSAAPAAGDELIELNKSLITRDRQVINAFISESDRSYTETATGLWYTVIQHGGGAKVKTGDNVTFDYECTLLDGNPCYSGTQTIRVGYTGTERGVTEGLQLMGQGSDFVFIIPPYLAHGHTGDGDKIPGRSILIYRIRIKEIG